MSIELQSWTVFYKDLASHLTTDKNSNLIEIYDDEHHYMTKVLRLNVGHKLFVTDGHGTQACGVTVSLDKKKTVIQLSEIKTTPTNNIKISILLGQPKPSTLEECVSLASKMGCSDLHIFTGDRTQIKTQPRIEKLQKISMESLRISKGTYATNIHYWESLEKIFFQTMSHENKTQSEEVFYFCDEKFIYDKEISKSFLVDLQELCQKKDLRSDLKTEMIFHILIGPESGFSKGERDFIIHHLHARPVNLGPFILEVPNALVSVMAVINQLFYR